MPPAGRGWDPKSRGLRTGSYKSNQEYMHRQAYKWPGVTSLRNFTLDHLCHTRDYRCPAVEPPTPPLLVTLAI